MPQFFISRPIFAWIVALFITLAGLLAIPNMPVSQYPDVAPPSIAISATYPCASAKEVADFVTSIIEDKLNRAKGLIYYESVSDSYGTATITATFAPGTDPDLAKARDNIAVAQYEQAIQQAFREVSDALADEATFTAQLDAQRALEASSVRTLELSNLRYDSDVDSYLQVQTAQVDFFNAQIALVQTGLASLSNRVELYKALGGVWQATHTVKAQ